MMLGMAAAAAVPFVRTADDRDALRPIAADRLCREPPRREWMVERCFAKGTVALVAGDGGIGKTLLMQQLVTAAASGRAWLGLAVTPGRAALLACEDDADELHRRQWSICRHYGLEMADALEGGLFLYDRVGKDNALARLDRKSWTMEPTQLAAKVMQQCLEHGVNYLVIDTATQTFAGNQNDEQQVMQFINILRRIAIRIEGAVIVTKHPSMSGRALGTGESGNTAWHNSVRSRFYLHKDKTKGLIYESKKSNYGPSDLTIPLRWEKGVYVLDQPQPAYRPYAD